MKKSLCKSLIIIALMGFVLQIPALAQTQKAKTEASADDDEKIIEEAERQLREAERKLKDARRKADDARRKAQEKQIETQHQKRQAQVQQRKVQRATNDNINMTIESDGEKWNWSFNTDEFERGMEKFGESLEKGFSAMEPHFERLGEGIGRVVEESMQGLEKSIVITEGEGKNQYYGSSNRTWRASDASKKKTLTFKGTTSEYDKVNISNKYGKIHINTWDKNDITVEVEIVAHASTEAKAEKLLQGIDIQQLAKDKTLILNTITTKSNTSSGNSFKGMEINYVVSMPKQLALQVKNSFGDIYIDDFKGGTDLNVSYGSMKINRLDGTDNKLKVAFGSCTADYIKEAKYNISYSTLKLDKGDKLDFKTDFSTLNLENMGDMLLNSRYDNIDIEQVNSLKGDARFTKINIEKVNERVEMTAQYCDNFEIEDVAKNFKLIDLNSKFGSIEVSFSEGTSFDFDTDFRFGDLRIDRDVAKFNVTERQNHSNSYKGTYGKSQGGIVKIKAEYGDARLKTK